MFGMLTFIVPISLMVSASPNMTEMAVLFVAVEAAFSSFKF